MKEAFRKAANRLFPEANVVVDHFHMIADANKRMDEARRIEQDVRHKGKVKIPKKIFLVARENLSDRERQKVDELLKTYPNLKGFYWAKERLRDVYRARDKSKADASVYSGLSGQRIRYYPDSDPEISGHLSVGSILNVSS